PIMQKLLKNIAPQVIDFLHIAKLLWTMADDLPRFKTTVKQQESQSLFTHLGKHFLQGPPYIISALFPSALLFPLITGCIHRMYHRAVSPFVKQRQESLPFAGKREECHKLIFSLKA